MSISKELLLCRERQEIPGAISSRTVDVEIQARSIITSSCLGPMNGLGGAVAGSEIS